ncbi:hypothetical protein MKW92_030492, partial [Papaver armeniacum]
NHEELILKPDGAYSQLIRLQEDANKVECMPPPDGAYDEDTSIRSLNAISPEAYKSMSVLADKDTAKTNDQKDQLLQRVFLMKLTYLNKPEAVILLLGSIASIIK